MAFEKAENWVFESIFQKLSDISYAYLRLTSFFWAIVSLSLSLLVVAWQMYIGLVYEHDPFILLLPMLLFISLFRPVIELIKKAHLSSYDHATWGLENEMKETYRKTRSEALLYTLAIFGVWVLSKLAGGHFKIGQATTIMLLMQYPTYCFCSCNVPGKRI